MSIDEEQRLILQRHRDSRRLLRAMGHRILFLQERESPFTDYEISKLEEAARAFDNVQLDFTNMFPDY